MDNFITSKGKILTFTRWEFIMRRSCYINWDNIFDRFDNSRFDNWDNSRFDETIYDIIDISVVRPNI